MSHIVINDKSECCGCSACFNMCPYETILMVADEKGFLYPQVQMERCIDCGLCERVCAFKNKIYEEPKRFPKVYAVKAKDDDVRFESTSGGMFTLLSDLVLNNGGIVYGVAFDENMKALHIRADSKEKRNLCRNSKYSQSDVNTVFSQVKQDLSEGREVLFTGTPCQTDALKTFLIGMNTDKLVLMDIVCHGVLSPKLYRDFIDFIEAKRHKKVVGYKHRAKDSGWGHNEKVFFSDGTAEKNTTLMQVLKAIFYKNSALRDACYNCKYTNFSRPSDITVADFWGIEKCAPDFKDNKGVSLVLLNTEKGSKYFDRLKDYMEFKEQTIGDACYKNPNLSKPSLSEVDMDLFWQQYHSNGFSYIAKKYGNYNLKHRVKKIIKYIIKKR